MTTRLRAVLVAALPAFVLVALAWTFMAAVIDYERAATATRSPVLAPSG